MRLIVMSVFFGLLTTQAIAQEKKAASKPGVVVINAASITATVEAIDYDKRTVALKGPRGNVVELKVGPDVKNFKQIKPGDRVTTNYYESTAILVRKPDEPPFAEKASAVQVARGPQQKTATLKVSKDVKRFGEVKKGDEVVIRHTEALAIDVRAAK